MKYLLLISFFLISQLTLTGQLSEIKFSAGLVHSDLQFPHTAIEPRHILNTPKVGFYAEAGTSYKLWKWISLEGNLTYQERWPLEIFRFSGGNQSFGVYVLGGWPTSPQSNLWDPKFYPRFPNFKYLHVDFIPMASFGKRLRIAAGVGIFYGRLLNKNQLAFGRKDFPSVDSIFDPPFNVSGEVKYNKDDVGFIPKLDLNYLITNRLRVGISMKAYVSQYALNEKRNYPSAWGRYWNTNWTVFTGGVEIRYVLNKKGKEK